MIQTESTFTADHERTQIEAIWIAILGARRIDHVGKTTLPTAIVCLRRCTLLVGNDSGLMHMAVGIPTLRLFGASRIEHYSL